MPTEQEYTDAAEDRIKGFARSAGEEIGPLTLAAIHSELKTMLQVGNLTGKGVLPVEKNLLHRILRKWQVQPVPPGLLDSPVKLGYDGPLFPEDKTEFNVVSVDVVPPGTPKPEVPGVAFTDPVPVNPMIPDMEPLPDYYGELYTLEDFRANVECGAIKDDDGSGEWATGNQRIAGPLRSYCNVFHGKAPDWATHVLWFTK